MNQPIANVTAATQAAWEDYTNALEEVRNQVLGSELCQDGKIRAQALYFLHMNQASAWGFYIAPRHAYPHLYIHSLFMPFELTTGQACPDFLYRWGFLDGARSYRMWGTKGDTRWTDIQVQTGHWGDENVRNVGNFSFDKLHVAADGSYEIILSATEQPGNWIRLDPSSANNMLLIREAWYDWEGETGDTMLIEALDRTEQDLIMPDEAELNRRLHCAARFLRYSANFSVNTTNHVLTSCGGTNGFQVKDASTSDVAGSNKAALFYFMIFEVKRDEALIIEFDVPQARYWGVSLGDVWWAGVDYSYHQSSLNGHQAAIDSDGKFRAVIAHTDPGVANWIDPVDMEKGVAMMRIYLCENTPEAKATLVPLNDLRQYLPADTATVDVEQRRDILARRKRASLRRYGF